MLRPPPPPPKRRYYYDSQCVYCRPIPSRLITQIPTGAVPYHRSPKLGGVGGGGGEGEWGGRLMTRVVVVGLICAAARWMDRIGG